MVKKYRNVKSQSDTHVNQNATNYFKTKFLKIVLLEFCNTRNVDDKCKILTKQYMN